MDTNKIMVFYELYNVVINSIFLQELTKRLIEILYPNSFSYWLWIYWKITYFKVFMGIAPKRIVEKLLVDQLILTPLLNVVSVS